jgi:hypothetical protein
MLKTNSADEKEADAASTLNNTFTDFLIVSIHTILELHELLPPTTFIQENITVLYHNSGIRRSAIGS